LASVRLRFIARLTNIESIDFRLKIADCRLNRSEILNQNMLSK